MIVKHCVAEHRQHHIPKGIPAALSCKGQVSMEKVYSQKHSLDVISKLMAACVPLQT